jgi:preprotein translocase subunit SecG
MGNKDLFFRLDPLFQGDDDSGLPEELGSTTSPAGESLPRTCCGGPGLPQGEAYIKLSLAQKLCLVLNLSLRREFTMNIFEVVMFVSAGIMILLILLQTRGASLGAGFGGSGELHTERRGVEKNIFQLTIIAATIFVGSIILSILIG